MHFELGEEVRVFDGYDDDRGHYEQRGDDLDSTVQEIAGQYFGFQDDLLDAIVEQDDCWPPDGDEPFLDRNFNYTPRPISVASYYERWEALREELRTRRRYFSAEASSFFSEIFSDIELLVAHSEGREESVVKNCAPGFEIYRGRLCNSDSVAGAIVASPFKEVGPPPSEVARSGRMNAEGISVLYASSDLHTCVAELRPSIGSRVAVITLVTTKQLRLVDFRALESSRKPGAISYFQDDFSEILERSAFIRGLHRVISTPVIPGREHEYLVTQLMAEYLGHVRKPAFDGIIFESVQKRGGANIVLFRGASDFPVSYRDNSVSFYSVSAMQYTHTKEAYFEKSDGSILFHFEGYDDLEW
ncbi:RES family NAD+ phosphorylase [Pseudoxanthomonas kaohsiungensis]|uniref:RES family NAD+ phosphorylase n=1 Tax=Pseudoxanthomonas kaohsiungensis TaxID=283923 RepID=A0ABW3M3A3_9GAMM|nr:RES family NAD+ phosphorylase [Pseudoxanthomonas kaohsiungensis]